ncbi:MAG: prepilin-type N-terminal cleavage/methylation domain-containing protein, partial [Planctomycetota bacterium]
MRTPTNHRENGFTLIEILIVTTIFGILAGVAVPNLMSSRLAANEAAVIATMRAISTAQFQFQSSGELDVDRDAGFEFGTFGELAALDELRGSSTK